MGRALDNAMLNVGLKDVAKGISDLPTPAPYMWVFAKLIYGK